MNYVDLDPGAGVADFRNGPYTYDGHNALDFTLANFAAMDAGVDVYAAAAGTVVEAHDGEFDRCSWANPCGNNPNYVMIEHANGVFTQYLHLKQDSVRVEVGQVVGAGEPIGLVGSSGLSTDPHLHFAVLESTPNGLSAVETYRDPARWWVDPVPYAGDVVGASTMESPTIQLVISTY